MPIEVPGKRYGKRLARSKVFGEGGHHKKGMFADLNVTPMVDLFVIIVLFLIANFSATGEVVMMSKEISLPEAAHVKEIDFAPVIQVSADAVIVNGKEVGKVEELTRDEYLNIPALEEELRIMKKQWEDLHALAQDANATFKGDVNIQGHKEVQFRIMKRVMYSCASAGYSNINFAVLSVSKTDAAAGGGAGAP